MLQVGELGVCLAILILPGQGDVIGNGFVGLTEDLGEGVNTQLMWSPRISADGLTLIFSSSDHPDSFGGWDLYMATRPNRTSKFDKVEHLGPTINTSSNEYNGLLSKDGKTFILTREIRADFYNLWVATRSDPSEPFGIAEPLDVVNGGYITAGPNFSLDELALFVCTTRPGGKGRDDIWVSLRDSADDPFAFGQPIPLEEYAPGSAVNSPFDEWNSTITGDGLALFFSDGWYSYRPGETGDFPNSAIYVSRRSGVDEPFGEPINLNDVSLFPVNCLAYDLSATVTPDWPRRGAQIFFISTRGSLQQSIWQATWEVMPEPRFSASPFNGPAPLEVSFDASETLIPEGAGPVTFAWYFGDGTNGEGEMPVHTYMNPSRHLVTLTTTGSAAVPTTAKSTITVSCPPGNAAPWTSADVASPLFPGSATWEGDDLFVCAGGKTLLGTADEFLFVDQEATGDFAAVARVSENVGWGWKAALGLMVRESRDPGSRHGAVLLEHITGGIQERIRYRLEEGKNSMVISGGTAGIPRWLRLERRGDLIVGSASPDGTAWEEVGRQEIPGLSATLRCGIAACGMDSDDPEVAFVSLRARLSNLSIAPLQTEALFVRGDSNADGAKDLSDAVTILGFLFLGETMNDCRDAADVNDDGEGDISDPVALLGHLFLGSDPPKAPWGGCGPDPTADGLDCRSFARCP